LDPVVTGRVHIGYVNGRGDCHRVSFSVEDSVTPNAVVEDAIEVLPKLAVSCADESRLSGIRISVAFTGSERFAETTGGLRSYVEQKIAMSSLPTRLRDAMAYHYWEVVNPSGQVPDNTCFTCGVGYPVGECCPNRHTE
jgi:hypothetical protein